MPVVKIPVSLSPDALALVDARGSARSTVINRELLRYAWLLAEARGRLSKVISDDEVGLLLEALSADAFPDAFSIQMIHERAAAGLTDEMLERWSVTQKPLLGKLQGLSTVEKLALVDALERWWYAYDQAAAHQQEAPSHIDWLKRWG